MTRSDRFLLLRQLMSVAFLLAAVRAGMLLLGMPLTRIPILDTALYGICDLALHLLQLLARVGPDIGGRSL